MDGMALDQWLIIKEMLGDEFFYTDDLVRAWVPTLTSISAPVPLCWREAFARIRGERNHPE